MVKISNFKLRVVFVSVFLFILQIGSSASIWNVNARVNIEKVKKDINWDDKDLYNEAQINLEIARRIQRENKRKKQLQEEGYNKQQIADIIKKERENANGNALQETKTEQAVSVKNNKNVDDNEDNDEDEETDDIEDSDFSSTKDGSIYYNKNSQEYKKPIITGDKERKQNKNEVKVNTNNVKDNAINAQEKKSEPKKIVIEDEEDTRDEYIYIKKKKKKPKTIVIEEESDDDDYNIVHKKISKANNGSVVNNTENFGTAFSSENIGNKKVSMGSIKDGRDLVARHNSFYQNQLTADDLNFLQMVNKTSKNMNNREHFSILARELGKMARNINVGQQNYGSNIFYSNVNQDNSFFDFYNGYEKYNPNEVNKNVNDDIYEDNEPVYKNRFVKQTSKKKQNNTGDGKYEKIEKSKLKNEKPLMYASTIGIDGSKIVANQKTTSESNETDKANIKLLKQEGDGFLTDKYTRKQVEAKNIGAPYPILRERKDYMSQYNPYNISQIEYDKNNQHLQPAVFERQIVNDVFAHLKDNNAIEVVKALINKIGKTDIQDDDGNTILMHAVALKNQAMIAMLLSEGANPNAINKDGFSPLHLASTNGDKVAIYYLMMGGGNPNLRDIDGNTSLMYASMTCGIDTLKMMISLGGNITLTNKSNRNKNVLDYAKLNQDKKVYHFLQNTIERTKGTKSINLMHS